MTIHTAMGPVLVSIEPQPCTHPNPDQALEYGHPGILEDGTPSHERITGSLRNGCYQHFLFLGISGFAICNHINREILLVDPWPTYHSYWTRVTGMQAVLQDVMNGQRSRRPLRDQDSAAKERIASLASFLRNAVEMGYTLIGILVSHMHFDHADDVALLLELLAADTYPQTVERGRVIQRYADHARRYYTLQGPPVPTESLPKICCDYDTLFHLLTYSFYYDYRLITIDGDERVRRPGRDTTRFWAGNGDMKEVLDERIAGERDPYFNQNTDAWRRVKDRYVFNPTPGSQYPAQTDNDAWFELTVGGHRLHYDDTFNFHCPPSQRCIAGEACEEFDLGHFRISPYVWDHMNTGLGSQRHEAQDEQSAGRLQRMTAFLVKHKDAEGAKRTFIVGSSGEFALGWTDAMTDISPPIETDLLIHAITRPEPGLFWFVTLDFSYQIDAYMDSLVRNIVVHDAIVFCHFEEFVREVADRAKFIECFDESVEYNLNVLRGIARLLGSTSVTDVIENNRIYVLARHGQEFEVDMPSDPEQFRREANTGQ